MDGTSAALRNHERAGAVEEDAGDEVVDWLCSVGWLVACLLVLACSQWVEIEQKRATHIT